MSVSMCLIGKKCNMEFRKFMLDDFLNGQEGQNCWTFFSHFAREFDDRDKSSRFYSFVTGLVNGEGYARSAFERASVFDYGDEAFASFDAFYDDMRSSFADANTAREMQDWIPFISVQLFLKFPEYAIPYLIPRHFYKLEVLCKEFGIKLPRMPGKNDHVARFRYYFDLCRVLHDFRCRCEMSPTEFCVFLYGYAMRFVDEIIQSHVMRNKMIFLLYASPIDREIFLSRELDPNEITIWQGRPEMMPGDIVLMYERAPRSCFSSVWRVVTPGFDDPFDVNSGKVFIGEHVDIPEISFAEFSKNVVWAENPLIAAHMQNGAGRACSIGEYRALIGMIQDKDPDFDVSRLPPVPVEENYIPDGLVLEHDVEVKLLEPLLGQLGFGCKDWTKQFNIRINRENTSRPDYVIYLDESGSAPTAKYVFEAKLTIPTKRQLRKDHGQALTYGNLLQSDAVALVAREGLWVSKREDRFDLEKVDFISWSNMQDAQALLALREVFKIN